MFDLFIILNFRSMNPNQPSTSDYHPDEEDNFEEYEELEGVDDDEDDANGLIDGIDVMPHLETSGNGAERTANDDEELVTAINMFMRNEYDYDEFMRVTGGQTLQEELGSGIRKSRKNKNDEEDTAEEEVYTADDDEEEEHEEELIEEEMPTTSDDSQGVEVPQNTEDRYGALPIEARYMITQVSVVLKIFFRKVDSDDGWNSNNS